MRLVYEKDNGEYKAGTEVKVGDRPRDFRGDVKVVTDWLKPTAPHKQGYVILDGDERYYCSVIDAKWIEREDQV